MGYVGEVFGVWGFVGYWNCSCGDGSCVVFGIVLVDFFGDWFGFCIVVYGDCFVDFE